MLTGLLRPLQIPYKSYLLEEIQVKIIHKGVGAITESDVLLASASDAIVIGFNVSQWAMPERLQIRKK